MTESMLHSHTCQHLGKGRARSIRLISEKELYWNEECGDIFPCVKILHNHEVILRQHDNEGVELLDT